MVKISAPPCAA